MTQKQAEDAAEIVSNYLSCADWYGKAFDMINGMNKVFSQHADLKEEEEYSHASIDAIKHIQRIKNLIQGFERNPNTLLEEK